MSIKEDFNDIQSTVKMMDEQMELLNTLVDSTIHSVHNLDMKVKKGLQDIHFDKILSMTDEEVDQFLIDNCAPDTSINIHGDDFKAIANGDVVRTPSNKNIDSLKENQKGVEEWKDKPFHDYARSVLKSIKDSMMEIQKLQAERDDLMKDMHNIQDDYFSYVNTKEYKDKKKEKLQELKNSIDQEENPVKRAEILRSIEYMENAESLQFLMDYIDEKGSRAVDNIADSYFNHERSSLIMKKFKVRVPKFGYNKDLYKFFFNIEENFLPEEYHVFNNLFLFHVMRTVSYMDVYSKRDNLYASSILVKLYHLVYHKFGDQALEDEFIEFIKKFDDLFREKWYDSFDQWNITHPKHPERIAKDKEAEKKRRIMTIAELQNHGIEPDTTKSTDELVKELKDVIEGKKIAQETELNEWKATQKNEEDNSEDTEEIPEATSGYVVVDSVPSDAQPGFTGEEKATIEEGVADIATAIEEGQMITVPAETGEAEASEGIQMNDDLPPVAVARGKTHGIMSKVAYMDKHGYYYMQVNDGTYSYFTPEDKVYETGFSEDIILKLLNTGSLDKVIKTFDLSEQH